MTEIVVVSDSHLGPGNPAGDWNWEAVASHVAARRPALVVHLGDLTLDGTERPAELAYARRRLDGLAAPWVAVPGNHDVGDSLVGRAGTSRCSGSNGPASCRWSSAWAIRWPGSS